ncbi:toll/interleukin-1 receptor domain-containing protein [Hymenobacter sp. 5317J-9]|uniref:toll/interleukin-1 receptor domain-containing protein n=1 Tax=Hymenobacter sp. 5317J-9 TaxID=2932250 RepID=UPI001FD6F638|nr:toll/interleukin-1 receptor domain-containing protein [Hymenobacter sp. 5317J-9]UOQ99857.1 toll/interleukin-1 receptor domain-containing protein [Hymenobacter sp. 5317J-9]
MRTELKIKKLENLLNQADSLDGLRHDDTDFLEWKESLEGAYLQIFGEDSIQFRKLHSRIFSEFHIGNNIPNLKEKHAANYKRDMRLTVNALAESIQDLRDEMEHADASTPASLKPKPQKVFISHASLDVAIAGDLIKMLRLLGLRANQILCTSIDGYDIPLGTRNYLDFLSGEIQSGAVVIFLLSKNFYKSPTCLAEMGAAWVLGSDMIPLVIPPFSFKEVEGVIPFTQGMMVNNKTGIHKLADALGKRFELSKDRGEIWETDRDEILTAMETHIKIASAKGEQADVSDVGTPTEIINTPEGPLTLKTKFL